MHYIRSPFPGAAVPRIRTAGVIATTTALALALSGCSVITAFEPHVESEIYDTAKDMKAADTAVFGSPTCLAQRTVPPVLLKAYSLFVSLVT